MTIVSKQGGGGGTPIHGNGNPEGVVTNTGVLYVDDDTQLTYTNPIVGSATGWELIQTQPA